MTLSGIYKRCISPCLLISHYPGYDFLASYGPNIISPKHLVLFDDVIGNLRRLISHWLFINHFPLCDVLAIYNSFTVFTHQSWSNVVEKLFAVAPRADQSRVNCLDDVMTLTHFLRMG